MNESEGMVQPVGKPIAHSPFHLFRRQDPRSFAHRWAARDRPEHIVVVPGVDRGGPARLGPADFLLVVRLLEAPHVFGLVLQLSPAQKGGERAVEMGVEFPPVLEDAQAL